MSDFLKASAAGAAGAAMTNMLHEVTRRVAPEAPRVDLLGMQSLNGVLKRAGGKNLADDDLYRATLAGDLVSNSLYFSAVGLLPRGAAVGGGLVLGALAGVGAVLLPGPLGLKKKYTARTTQTRALTVALYAAGGLTAGVVCAQLRDRNAGTSADASTASTPTENAATPAEAVAP